MPQRILQPIRDELTKVRVAEMERWGSIREFLRQRVTTWRCRGNRIISNKGKERGLLVSKYMVYRWVLGRW